MSQYLKVRQRIVPGSLEDLVGTLAIEKIFAMIDDNNPVEKILESGIADRAVTATLLMKLQEENIIEKVLESGEPDPSPLDTSSQAGKGHTPIQLVTDSASDIPEDMARDRNITIVPLTVSINGKDYQDGVDITPPRFYSMMAKKGSLPITSPPAPETFHEMFTEHIGQKDILGIFISRKMSKTFDVASQAKMNNYNTYLKQRMANPGVNKKLQIELIDSRLVSMGATLLVLEAADKIEEGWPLQKIKEHINKRINDVKVFFMVDNLDHLVRGGRIGRGSALFGKLLGFKPILGMAGGGVDAKSKSFGGRRAQGKLIEYMKSDLGGTSRPIRIGICHAGSPEKASTVRNLVQEAFPHQEHYTTYFGPTVGAHTGPGAVGVAWLPSQEE